jgi:hypothetical protein
MKRSRSAPLNPTGRTPWVTARLLNKAMPDCVRVHIVQPRQMGLLVGKQSLPVLKPNGSARSSIHQIDFFCGHRMQMPHQSSQSARLSRFPNKVVVIRENGPSLKFPIVLASERQQRLRQVRQTRRVMEVMRPVVSCRGDYENPRIAQPMRGRVWPIRSGAF